MSRLRLIALSAGLVLAGAVLAAAFYYRADIVRTALDPKLPFQTYDPPAAPNYADPRSYALIPPDPARPAPGPPAADVFFIHPTTFDGGREWNGPLDDGGARRLLTETMLPNYAGPFLRVGRLFAPLYRQASLYAFLSRRDDAREARRFAYDDVAAAFELYLQDYNQGRPLVIAGVEQGGSIAARLVGEALARHPELKARLAAVYLIDVVVPADAFGPGSATPACTAKGQTGCVLAWAAAPAADLEYAFERRDRALVWDSAGQLVEIGEREPLCVNPVLGARTGELSRQRDHLGAANATGVEWGVRPAFLSRQVTAQCVDGLLRVSKPRSKSLRPQGSWTARQRAPQYNLFYADIEADAERRVAALAHAAPPPLRRAD